MFRIPCPHCGLRNVSEFNHAGERRERPDPASATAAQWRSYLYGERNVAGWTAESWFHALGCRRFLTVERHTLTNEVRPTSDVSQGDPEPGAPTTAAPTGAPDSDVAP